MADIDSSNQMLVIMGVAGSGKSTIAAMLSQMHLWPMIEGDALHPQSNREKMAGGTPLTNADRMPWLDAIAKAANALPDGPVVLACSALDEEIRARIVLGVQRPCRWFFLDVPEDILALRLKMRVGHFMPGSLLASQLQALHLSPDIVRVDGTSVPKQVCLEIIDALGRDVTRMDM